MEIAPFSFKEFSEAEGNVFSSGSAREFLPQSRKKEAAAPPPPPPPTFSENEMRESERAGYQKGYLEGIEEGKKQAHDEQAQVNIALLQNVEQFTGQMAPLFSMYRDMLKEAGRQVPELAQAIARKVAECALEEKAYQVVEDVAKRCLETMFHEPKLTIIVHESLNATLEKNIREAAENQQFPGEIIVVGDPAIAPANCRIEWKNGAMVRDTEQLWQHVEQVIDSMVASNERDAEALTDALQSATPATPDNVNITDTTQQPPEGE